VPSGVAPKSHKLRGAVLIVLLVVVVVLAVDPSARNRATSYANRIRYDIVPSYSMVPLKSAVASGGCNPAVLANNDTVYWYTRSTRDAPQSLTMTISPNFKGTIGVIAFTPLQAPLVVPSGSAAPAPYVIRIVSQPLGTVVTSSLDDPPKFLKVDITNVNRTELVIQAINTDSGAGLGSCAETGVVLWERKT